MRTEIRKNLLAEYAVALVAEREAWERLREHQLSEAERCHALAQWKQTAARLKTLARQLRAAPPRPVGGSQGRLDPQAPPSEDGGYLAAPKAGGRREAALPVAAAVPGSAPGAAWRRQPFLVPWLVGSIRLITAWHGRS